MGRGSGPALRLWSASPMRLALGLLAIFLTFGFLSAGAVFLELRSEVRDTLRATLESRVARLAGAGDALAQRAAVRAEAASSDPEREIVVLVPPSGPQEGNATVALAEGRVVGLHDPAGAALAVSDYEFRLVAGAAGTIVSGQTLAPVDELHEAFLRILSYSLLPTAVLSLAAALLAGRSSARRVARIEATLDALATGDLDARVSENGRSDDLARISGGVDRMAAAQQANIETLRQISADIAHDLKTPVQRLTVLLGELRTRLPDDSAEADLADRAVSEADHAAAVFQGLLQIAQIEGGLPRSRFNPVDLARLLADVAEVYAPAAEESGRPLAIGSVTAPPTEVMGDRHLLGQALANLIENALRHTPPGTAITLSLAGRQDGLALMVADTGPGIPAAERDKVTRRLYRLDRSRRTPGSGLGLALVKAVADLHGAELAFADNGPGLAVTLTFPRAAA